MIALIQSRLGALRAAPHVREAAREALGSLSASLPGVLLAFAFSVMLARLLGAEGAGLFFLALSVVLVAEAAGRFGLERSLERFVPAGHARRDWGSVAGAWRRAIGTGAAVSILMALLVAVLAAPLASHVFGKPALHSLLLILSAAIVPRALTRLYAAALLGMRRVLICRLLQNALPFALAIALLIPLVLHFGKSNGAALSYVAGWTMAFGIGWWCWAAVLDTVPRTAPEFARARLLASCLPMLAVTLPVLMLTQLPAVFIGIWWDAKEVAIFSAAARIALLGAFLLHSMVSILLPKFSGPIASGRPGELESAASHSALVAALCIAPLWIAVLLFPGQMLALFGEEFREGAAVLMVVFTGQMLFGIFGVGGEILMMGGNDRMIRRANSLSLLLCFAACLLLVPAHGSMGAAVAICLAYAGHAAICQLYLKRRYGFWVGRFRGKREANPAAGANA